MKNPTVKQYSTKNNKVNGNVQYNWKTLKTKNILDITVLVRQNSSFRVSTVFKSWDMSNAQSLCYTLYIYIPLFTAALIQNISHANLKSQTFKNFCKCIYEYILVLQLPAIKNSSITMCLLCFKILCKTLYFKLPLTLLPFKVFFKSISGKMQWPLTNIHGASEEMQNSLITSQ